MIAFIKVCTIVMALGTPRNIPHDIPRDTVMCMIRACHDTEYAPMAEFESNSAVRKYTDVSSTLAIASPEHYLLSLPTYTTQVDAQVDTQVNTQVDTQVNMYTNVRIIIVYTDVGQYYAYLLVGSNN